MTRIRARDIKADLFNIVAPKCGHDVANKIWAFILSLLMYADDDEELEDE